jgi:hypothetical protein
VRSGRRWAAVVAAVLLLGLAPPAGAHDLGPSQVLIASRGMEADVAVAVDGDGLVHGFANVTGRTTGEIRYFEGRGSSWTVLATPYRGDVLSVAVDRTGSYVLHRAADGLRIAKRLRDGRWTGGHLLVPQAAVPPVASVEADLVAVDGRWWAVWSWLPAAQLDVFEAGTFGGGFRSGRVTGSLAPDRAPTLALTPSGAALVWQRGGDLWTASADRPGRWTGSRHLLRSASGPDLVVDGSTWHLSYLSAGVLRYGRGSAAGLRTERVSADEVRDPAVLAVSGGRAVLVHSVTTGSSVLLRTRAPGGWWRTSALWASYDSTNVAVTSHRGRATAFVGATKALQVLVRSQEP